MEKYDLLNTLLEMASREGFAFPQETVTLKMVSRDTAPGVCQEPRARIHILFQDGGITNITAEIAPGKEAKPLGVICDGLGIDRLRMVSGE